ncbi:unnamed protein product, partial [Hapterophycus canaliculatus]
MAMVAAPPAAAAGGAQTAFTYSSEPQAVPPKRSSVQSKYREDVATTPDAAQWIDENDMLASNNIMYDRRVVRGNTYAAQVVTQSAQRESSRLRQEHERRMRLEALRRRQAAEFSNMPRTPPPVEGRMHMDAQTEEFLEELTDRPVEMSIETQTEAFMDRPPSPLFVPAKTGMDADTQVVVGELFDFDLEVVEPILEVLVGKTLELSVLELMEASIQLAVIRRRQATFARERDAEMAEVQRMEAEAKRKSAEKVRRMKQQQEFKQAREALLEKVAARSFAKNYLSSLKSDVFNDLEDEGHFYDPLAKEVKEVFLPWLMDDVVQKVDKAVESMAVVDGLLSEAATHASRIHREAVEAKEAERSRTLAAALAVVEEARRKEAEEEAAARAAKEALEREEAGGGEEGEEGDGGDP